MDHDEDGGSPDNYIGMNDSVMTAADKQRSSGVATIEEEKNSMGDTFGEGLGKIARSMNGDENSLDEYSFKESEQKVNGEALVDDVEQICLSGEEEEKRYHLA